MAIPDFQTMLQPLLELHADAGEKPQGELRAALAHTFELTPEDLAERIPSGPAGTFANRVARASTHLKAAGLLVKPRHGISRITERAQTVLRGRAERVDISVLEQLPEHGEPRIVGSRKPPRRRSWRLWV